MATVAYHIMNEGFKSRMSDINDSNSFRSVSSLLNKSTSSSPSSPSSVTLITSKKRFRDEEDLFADIIRTGSSSEISDQADEAEHRELCKNISLSLFESRKLLCSAPSSSNLTEYKNENEMVNSIFSNFIKDMAFPVEKSEISNSDNVPNFTALDDFLSASSNIWNDIYVLEQEKK